MQDSPPYCAYFLFVNSSSGGGVGSKLIQQQAQKITFQIQFQESKDNKDTKRIFDIYFYNMKTHRQKGFTKLKTVIDNNINTKIIVCGGDGTVIWVVSQMNKYNINTDSTPIGIIPLGTGNDFSQYLGWGKLKTTLIENSFKSLKKLIKKWEYATIQIFDIWDVKAQVYEHGKFQKVQNMKVKQMQIKTFERSFCNYFSFGLDGKIGYSFDLHRTGSRIGNLAMYGIMGMLKAITKTKKISELLHKMQILQQISSTNHNQTSLEKQHKKNVKILFQEVSQSKQQQIKQQTSKIIFNTNRNTQKVLRLKRQSYSIVALNINSFMGGVFDIWKNASNAIENQHNTKFKQMNSGDGQLQFVSFTSSIGMAAQRSLGGFAQKVTQGSGPYYFQFKQYDPKVKHRTYLQVDGQFIRFTHPKSVTIRHSIYGNKGKIKVLRNFQQK